MRDEAGGTTGDYALILALAAAAVVAWLDAMGGTTGILSTLWGVRAMALAVSRSAP